MRGKLKLSVLKDCLGVYSYTPTTGIGILSIDKDVCKARYIDDTGNHKVTDNTIYCDTNGQAYIMGGNQRFYLRQFNWRLQAMEPLKSIEPILEV